MHVLLDTNILLWAIAMPGKLDEPTRGILQSRANEILFSAVSIWEIAIKYGTGRIDFAMDPNAVLAEAVDAGFRELPVRAAVAATVAALPLHHKDPFDRLLLAQAFGEPACFMTSDSLLAKYSSLVTVVRRVS